MLPLGHFIYFYFTEVFAKQHTHIMNLTWLLKVIFVFHVRFNALYVTNLFTYWLIFLVSLLYYGFKVPQRPIHIDTRKKKLTVVMLEGDTLVWRVTLSLPNKRSRFGPFYSNLIKDMTCVCGWLFVSFVSALVLEWTIALSRPPPLTQWQLE